MRHSAATFGKGWGAGLPGSKSELPYTVTGKKRTTSQIENITNSIAFKSPVAPYSS